MAESYRHSDEAYTELAEPAFKDHEPSLDRGRVAHMVARDDSSIGCYGRSERPAGYPTKPIYPV